MEGFLKDAVKSREGPFCDDSMWLSKFEVLGICGYPVYGLCDISADYKKSWVLANGHETAGWFVVDAMAKSLYKVIFSFRHLRSGSYEAVATRM
jgi:hypothetical protein